MSCNCDNSSDNPLSRLGIGKRLERQNPLPPGIYWTDLIGNEAMTEFALWITEHKPFVQILNHEIFGPLGWTECPLFEDCGGARAWVKFQVVIATEWNSKSLGFPTVIEPGEVINNASDTVSEPDFSDNCDIACQAKWVAVAGGVILGGIALIVGMNSFRR